MFCRNCFSFQTAVELCHVTFNESCIKFIVSIIIVVMLMIFYQPIDLFRRIVPFYQCCVYTIITINVYQSRRRISRVNILHFVWYGGSNEWSGLLLPDNNEIMTKNR